MRPGFGLERERGGEGGGGWGSYLDRVLLVVCHGGLLLLGRRWGEERGVWAQDAVWNQLKSFDFEFCFRPDLQDKTVV
jgi:hypothetical protein